MQSSDRGQEGAEQTCQKEVGCEVMRVCLDAGHGGSNIGAVYPPLVERKMNLQLQGYIAGMLLIAGHDVLMLRVDDVSIKNSHRAVKANNWDADVFVSIHHNAYHLASANGFEVLYWPTSSTGKAYAESLCDKVCDRWDIRNRGAKPRRNLVVLRASRMPAILIEAGFISSTVDRRSLKLLVHRNAFYLRIAESLVEVLSEND